MTVARLANLPKLSTPEAILAAARNAFLTSGYENTSMDTIARDADVSKATLYAHFDSKDALFLSVMQGATAEYQSRLDAMASEEKGDFVQQLTRAGISILEYMLNPATLRMFRIVISEGTRIPAVCQQMISSRRQKSREMIAGIFRYGQTAGTLSPHDSEEAAILFLALLKGELFWDCLVSPAPPPTKAQIQNYIQKIVSQAVRLYATNSSR